MYLLKFTAHKGSVSIEKLFKEYNDAIAYAFKLEEGRADSEWSIEAVKVQYEQ